MPGVLIVEAMAQAGGILLLKEEEEMAGRLVFFMGMDNIKFRKPVLPGDQLVLEMTMLKARSTTFKMAGKAFVKGDLVCEGEMMAGLVER